MTVEDVSARVDVLERVLSLFIARTAGRRAEVFETVIRQLAEAHLMNPDEPEARRWRRQDQAALKLAEQLSRDIGHIRATEKAKRPPPG